MAYGLLAVDPGIEIFGFKITAYAIIIVCGIILAYFLITALFKRRNISPDLFLTLFCICLPVCLVTTRLFYCLTGDVPIEDWFSFEGIRSGGLSIIGGILGGIVSVSLFCIIKKVNFLRIADCVVVGLIVAQGIGRWGNFANQEVYGAVVENEALQCFPFAVYINETAGGNCMQTFTLTFAKWFGFETDIMGGTWHYAFCFYESFFNLAVGALLFWNGWKNGKKPNGVNMAGYFIAYGLVRSIMEPLRDPSYILNAGGIQWSFVFSLLLLIGGVATLVTLLVLNKRKEGAFIGSLNGDPYGITAYIKDSKDEKAYRTKINMMCAIYPDNYVDKEENDEKKEKEGKEE